MIRLRVNAARVTNKLTPPSPLTGQATCGKLPGSHLDEGEIHLLLQPRGLRAMQRLVAKAVAGAWVQMGVPCSLSPARCRLHLLEIEARLNPSICR